MMNMDWLQKLNDSLDCIERRLAGELDVKEAAQIAGCSAYHYQRMFSYLAGTPLSEYVRRRRMSLAAVDLQNGGKVVDVALKYGYESPTAFNRAFQSVHGVAPSAAQKEGASLKAFPRISFTISIKGETEMEYRIEKREEIRIVGVSTPLSKDLEENFQEAPALWGRAATDGTVMRLAGMMDTDPKGVLGVSACHGEAWRYYVAVATTQPVPEGMEEYTVPACTWAVFSGKGPMPGAIQELEKRIVTEWLPTSGYEYANAPDIELYLEPNPVDATFEVWLPVTKK